MDRLKIIAAVSQEIGIDAAFLSRMKPAVLINCGGIAIFKKCSAAGIAKSESQIYSETLINLFQQITAQISVTIASVKGSCGTF